VKGRLVAKGKTGPWQRKRGGPTQTGKKLSGRGNPPKKRGRVKKAKQNISRSKGKRGAMKPSDSKKSDRREKVGGHTKITNAGELVGTNFLGATGEKEGVRKGAVWGL